MATNTKTVGDTGDYANLTAAISAINTAENDGGGNFLNKWILEMQAQDHGSDGAGQSCTFSFTNKTTSTNCIIVRPVAGAYCAGVPKVLSGASTVRLYGAAGNVRTITISTNCLNIEIYGFEIANAGGKSSTTTDQAIHVLGTSGAPTTTVTVHDLVIHNDNQSSSAVNHGIAVPTGANLANTTLIAYRNIIYGMGGSGISIGAAGAGKNHLIYYNTCYKNAVKGIVEAAVATTTVKNNYCGSNGTGDYSVGLGTFTNNVSSDGSGATTLITSQSQFNYAPANSPTWASVDLRPFWLLSNPRSSDPTIFRAGVALGAPYDTFPDMTALGATLTPDVGAYQHPITAPTIYVGKPAVIGSTTATLSMTIVDDGGDLITERGHVLSASIAGNTLVIANADFNPKTTSGTSSPSTGTFTNSGSALTRDTLYYDRAYVKTGYGTTYTASQANVVIANNPTWPSGASMYVAQDGYNDTAATKYPPTLDDYPTYFSEGVATTHNDLGYIRNYASTAGVGGASIFSGIDMTLPWKQREWKMIVAIAYWTSNHYIFTGTSPAGYNALPPTGRRAKEIIDYDVANPGLGWSCGEITSVACGIAAAYGIPSRRCNGHLSVIADNSSTAGDYSCEFYSQYYGRWIFVFPHAGSWIEDTTYGPLGIRELIPYFKAKKIITTYTSSGTLGGSADCVVTASCPSNLAFYRANSSFTGTATTNCQNPLGSFVDAHWWNYQFQGNSTSYTSYMENITYEWYLAYASATGAYAQYHLLSTNPQTKAMDSSTEVVLASSSIANYPLCMVKITAATLNTGTGLVSITGITHNYPATPTYGITYEASFDHGLTYQTISPSGGAYTWDTEKGYPATMRLRVCSSVTGMQSQEIVLTAAPTSGSGASVSFTTTDASTAWALGHGTEYGD